MDSPRCHGGLHTLTRPPSKLALGRIGAQDRRVVRWDDSRAEVDYRVHVVQFCHPYRHTHRTSPYTEPLTEPLPRGLSMGICASGLVPQEDRLVELAH